MPENDCLSLIKRKLSSLPAAERRIAGFILAEPDRAVTMTMRSLAETCRVSDGSVANFASRLGYDGFTSLKIAIAQSLSVGNALVYETVSSEDSPRDVLNKVCANSVDALRATCETMPDSDLNGAVNLLLGATRRIEVYGIGSSAMLAEDAAFRFIKLGLPAVAVRDSYIGSASALMLDHDCTALAISYTGRTRDLLKTMSIAREKGAKTLCITCFADSPLAKMCDLSLIAVSGEAAASKLATVSRLAQLMIVDAICAAIEAGRRDSAIEKQSEIVRAWGDYWVTPE